MNIYLDRLVPFVNRCLLTNASLNIVSLMNHSLACRKKFLADFIDCVSSSLL